MWFATTDDEANFIFDLLADRDANEPMLAYARWLEDRGEHRAAEFLRLELSPAENAERLKVLRQELDTRWVGTVMSRRFRRGDVVRIMSGVFQGMEGSVVEVDPRGARAGLFLHIFYRPTEWTWVDFSDLRLVKPARQDQCQD
ncbi:MAG TPA: KOW motif-containing protein [Gemmataceae bacterium]|nr:KOW motif-containing protein [Gemmataceae bacterium]